MKAVVAVLAAILLSALLAFYRVGLRPFHAPYDLIKIQAEARDYWIDFQEGRGRPALLRHKWGGAWPIPPFQGSAYVGESGTLHLLETPGLDRRFLVLRCVFGAYTLRNIVWELRPHGQVRLAADIAGVGEVPGLLFQDADGDGREELAESHRRWLFDENGEMIESWGLCTTFHAWTGRGFEPRWAQLCALGQSGPLVPPDDPASEDPFRAGLDIGDAR